MGDEDQQEVMDEEMEMDLEKEEHGDSACCWPYTKRVMDLCATFLLEVMGGAGAVWGSSECAGVRVGEINNEWRAICWGAFILCVLRWGAREFFGVVHGPMEVLAVFLLDVLGGAGAMWGCLEIGGYRSNYPVNCHDITDSPQGRFQGIGGSWGPPGQYESCAATFHDSRIVCAPIFILCWMAWQKVIVGNASFYLRTYLLQVMGGAGALWGFSEICGEAGDSLRYGWGDVYFGQKSFDYWRVCCGVVFIFCNIRWICVCLIPGPPEGWNENNIIVKNVAQFDEVEMMRGKEEITF